MNGDEMEQRLRRQRLPEAPEALASRILAAAAVLPGPRAIAWSDRIWFSRAARLAWAVAVLLLLAAELAVAPGRSGPARREGPDSPSTMAELATELRLDPSWGARRVVVEAPGDEGVAEIEALENAL